VDDHGCEQQHDRSRDPTSRMPDRDRPYLICFYRNVAIGRDDIQV
jgi:hypothetical protein